MKNIFLAFLSVFIMSCEKNEEAIQEVTKGYNMLLIGNSFFKPYAQHLDAMAMSAGFENHSATVVFRGGENGRAINFWNDSNSSAHNTIKTTLDQGGIDYFGMTAGGLPDDPTAGFKDWIEYALQSNPNITIFISIPPVDFPQDWDQLAQNNGFDSIQALYNYYVNEILHIRLIDELRTEFPSTKIFSIPTGWAAINLAQMNLDHLLLDDIEMFGPKPTSIFTDQKGHQGQIVIETGTLIWINSIYNVDLSTLNYETGFDTDLHAIAEEIVNNHDSNYKQ